MMAVTAMTGREAGDNLVLFLVPSPLLEASKLAYHCRADCY